jgi:hypothetical protein
MVGILQPNGLKNQLKEINLLFFNKNVIFINKHNLE